MFHEVSPQAMKLTEQVDALSDALAQLGEPGDVEDLLAIMRRPGWTTPAEFAFASAAVALLRAPASVEKFR